MTMIEKVARAIVVSLNQIIDSRVRPDPRHGLIACAKAAIAAMREPTEEMSIAGMNTQDGSPTTAYKLMIDAALKE